MSRVRWPVAAVLVLVLGAAVAVWWTSEPQRRLVAQFSRTVGIHAGSDVRVLGVKIGDVVAVTPQGRTVRVEMRYEPQYRLPADVQAIVVPPSIVSDRYIQLTPAYNGGATFANGGELSADRTAVPLELDEIYRSLDELNQALGPDGANSDGALSDLVKTGRKNLEGNGDELHAALDGLSKALSTVADGREDLFGTIANLQEFTTTLARSDDQVRKFNAELAGVSEQLAAERDDLAAALRELATALADITAFIRDNRKALSDNVAALADVSGILVRQQRALIDVLDVAPLTLSNLNLVYNPRSGTLDTRDNAMGPYDPASFVCSLLVNLAPKQVPKECFDLAKLLSGQKLPLTGELRRLLKLSAGPSSGGASVMPVSSGGASASSGAGLDDLLRGGL